jgi:uncharacterized protein
LARIAALYRYPIKGLSPEKITEAMLEKDGHFPGDRLFALENGPSGFDAKAPGHMPKIRFLVLMRNERLAQLQTRFDPETGRLTIRQAGEAAIEADIRTEDGQQTIEDFFTAFMRPDLRGPVRLLTAPQGFRFMDSRSGFVSILNRATIDAIAAAAGEAGIDPRRFRGNILIDGLEAFAENDLVGRTITLGDAELEILKRTERCAATDVDPDSGLRNIRMVNTLERAFGHHDCGVYARISRSGVIRTGDRLEV